MHRWIDQSEIARITGTVVPAYFSGKPSDEMVLALLRMTLSDCPHYLPLGHVWVVVDGDRRTTRLLEGLRDEMLREHGSTFGLLPLPENRGKLWAMKVGSAALLDAQPAVQFIVIRDGDGDHAMSEVPSLVRAGLHLANAFGSTRVIAIGSRRSRHHPMGWVRGELETLLDAVTVDALSYALARHGQALDLSNCLIDSSVPDLSSGFKAYGRDMAESLFSDSEPDLASLSASNYWHYGPETVTVIEAVLEGCALGEKLRLTWDGQPTTSFGEFGHQALYGELLAYVFTRLEIPLAVAAQFLDNRAPRLALRTSTQGREMLVSLREYVLCRVQSHRGKASPIPLARPTLPFL